MEIRGIENLQNLEQMKALVNLERSSQIDPRVASKVKEEFMALFYKEILKQAFKPPTSGFGEEGEENSMLGAFSSDMLVEKLALELARSKSFRAEQLFQ